MKINIPKRYKFLSNSM